MKPAVSYARLSLTGEGTEPTLAFQHKRNVEFLTELGYTVPKSNLFSEPKGHRSGRFIQQRPAMRELVARLDEYSAVAVFDFSRFARNFRFAFDFVDKAAKSDVKLYNTSNRKEITIRNASEYIETGIQAMFSEYESMQGSDRMKNAYARARENGWVYHRRPPLGLKVIGSKNERRFEKAPDFKTVIAFLELATQGTSAEESAKILRGKGHKARNLKGQSVPLQPYHLRKIIQILSVYKPFVPESLYNAARRRLSERSHHQSNAPLQKHPLGILKGILCCASCGRKWRTNYARNHQTGWFASYVHGYGYLCENNRRVTRHKLDSQVLIMLNAVAKRISEQPEIINAVIAQLNAKAEYTTGADDKAALQRQLHNLRVLISQGDMTAEDLADFHSQKKEIESQLAKLGEVPKAKEVTFGEWELRQLLAQSQTWVTLAESDPSSLNLILRDLFERITVDRKNVLRFKPRAAFKALFRDVLNVTL